MKIEKKQSILRWVLLKRQKICINWYFIGRKEDNQMKKPVFLNPEMEIIKVGTEDVIKTSLQNGGTMPEEGDGNSSDITDIFPGL